MNFASAPQASLRSTLWGAFALLLASALTSGCISVKSYPDPSVTVLKYESLQRPAEPLKLRVTVEFQRNGTHMDKVDKSVQDKVERILRASGVVVPVADAAAGEFHVVLNNLANKADAATKGAATGLTFGLVANTVKDQYEMSVTITANGNTFTRTGIQNAIFTIVGSGSGPAGVETMPVGTAFDKVLEQMLITALKDYQQQQQPATTGDSGAATAWQRISTLADHLLQDLL